jgi:hypothetical protein
MRRENLLLGIVCIVSIIGSHLLANYLNHEQGNISRSRNMVRNIPLAGFHKFAADIYWMLFLQYAGANPINKTNVGEFEYKINQIIDLDPNFMRIYHEGALMLAPVDQDKALALLDKGIAHPYIGQNWRLPMLAGQLIMRRQWDNYYSNQEMDIDQVKKAKYYYELAMKAPGRQGTAINSYIRVCAALATNDKSREYNELKEWYNFWQDNRYGPESYGLGMGMGDGGGSGGYSPFADTQDYGAPFDIGEKIISVMRKARAKYPDDEELNTLVEQVKSRIFPGIRFNDSTLEPIRPDAVRMVDGFIDTVRPKRYTLLLQAPVELTVLSITGRSSSGEVTLSVLVDGEVVEGLSEITMDDEIRTFDSSGANRVAAGSMVELEVIGTDDGADLSHQVEFYFSQSY